MKNIQPINDEESKKQQSEYMDRLYEKRKKLHFESEAHEARQGEIKFMQNNVSDFTDTLAKKLYYETTPIIDSILTILGKLQYEVDRLDDNEYDKAFDVLRSDISKLSLCIKKHVIDEQVENN